MQIRTSNQPTTNQRRAKLSQPAPMASSLLQTAIHCPAHAWGVWKARITRPKVIATRAACRRRCAGRVHTLRLIQPLHVGSACNVQETPFKMHKSTKSLAALRSQSAVQVKQLRKTRKSKVEHALDAQKDFIKLKTVIAPRRASSSPNVPRENDS